MREITVYRMRQFFADELKRLELFADLAAGINLEATLLIWRLQTKAAKLLLETQRSQAQILPHHYFFNKISN